MLLPVDSQPVVVPFVETLPDRCCTLQVSGDRSVHFGEFACTTTNTFPDSTVSGSGCC